MHDYIRRLHADEAGGNARATRDAGLKLWRRLMHGRFNPGLTQAVKQREGPPLHVVRAFAWGGEGPRQLRGFGRGLLLRHVLQRRHHLVQHFRQLGRTQPLHRDKRGRQSGRVGDNSCSDLFDLSGCFAMRSTEPALKFPERFVKRRPIHARSWCARLGQTRRMHRSKLPVLATEAPVTRLPVTSPAPIPAHFEA